jgi:Rrf2 family iron-sulfur cluster assembly transcriptional regulator
MAAVLTTTDLLMLLLPRKGILAIAAVIDIALHARGRPVLQALVRHGILKGIRGPRGGYELAREQRRITADDILRAAGTIDEIDAPAINGSNLLEQVVIPALSQAEQAFSAALARINIEELARSAEGMRRSGTDG